jgi:hypothetical protein
VFRSCHAVASATLSAVLNDCGCLLACARVGSGAVTMSLYAGTETNATSLVSDCVFDNNTCTQGDAGGLYLFHSHDNPTNLGYSACASGSAADRAFREWSYVRFARVSNTTFVNNSCPSLGANGGGLTVLGGGHVTVQGCSFDGNSALSIGYVRRGSRVTALSTELQALSLSVLTLLLLLVAVCPSTVAAYTSARALGRCAWMAHRSPATSPRWPRSCRFSAVDPCSSTTLPSRWMPVTPRY